MKTVSRFRYPIESTDSRLVIFIDGVIGMVSSLFKREGTIYRCNVSMEDLEELQAQGQGVLSFEFNPKTVIWFALPDKE